MLKRLVILSDLWGEKKSEWLINYTQVLKEYFNIVIYDCCELARIDKSSYTEKSLHNQFVNGGIERAVKELVKIEKNSVNILAFSIGGTIAWKFGIKSNKIDSLICLSSTRLRYESIKPKGKINLYFGSKDNFAPSLKWYVDMSLDYHDIKNRGHHFYREPEFSKLINNQIIKNINKTKL